MRETFPEISEEDFPPLVLLVFFQAPTKPVQQQSSIEPMECEPKLREVRHKKVTKLFALLLLFFKYMNFL
jgi:hypothetical protein